MRISPRLAVVILGTITFLFVVAGVVLMALPRTTPVPDYYGSRALGPVFPVVVSLVGGAIALRQPRNSVGWILLVSGMFLGLLGASIEYSGYALVEQRGALGGGEWAVWLGQLALPWAVGPIATFLLLVFPDGRLPSPRWRPVAWYTAVMLVAWPIAGALLPRSVGFAPSVPNPVTLPADISLEQSQVRLLGIAAVIPVTIMCAAAFIQRFRHARGHERQQLKWVAYATAILVFGVAVVLPISFGRKPLEIAQQLSVLAVPLATGIAILRYRLFDIDLLINRTLVYGATSAVIAVTFFAGIVALQALLSPLTSGNELAVAASTLVSFALFQHVRRRVQEAVDRRFDRSRYDAARTLELFADRLRDEVDLDNLRADLLGAVRQTMGPAHVSLWLRERTQ